MIRRGVKAGVWVLAKRQSDKHDESGDADLECGELRRRQAWRGVREREQVSGEGDGAGKGEQVAETDRGEEMGPCGSGGRGEEEKSGEGQGRADGGSPARRVGSGGAEGGNRRKEWNKHDYEAGDEGGLRGRGASEAAGLKLVAGGEENTYKDS